MDFKYIGKGIYSISEASKLTGVSNIKILRWVYGYTYKYRNDKRKADPVITHDYEKIDNKGALSFLDLIQLLFIKQFRLYGVSLHVIRLAAERARELVNFRHPFATHKFYTDGRNILAQIAYETKEFELINLLNSQYEINDMVSPLLFGGLDFAEMQVVQRWWPNGKDEGVVVDPAKNFGKPIVEKVNIPTELLSKYVRVMGSITEVAEWYEIDPESVKAAVKFENSLVA
jgi:uncharacterized protein (DUF433 family)/DNA-binding transcriptional MerR regulator